MLVYLVVTKDGIIIHAAKDFDEAEVVAASYAACACDQILEERPELDPSNEKDVAEAAFLAGWENGVDIHEVDTDDAVLELDEGSSITLKELRERLGADTYDQMMAERRNKDEE